MLRCFDFLSIPPNAWASGNQNNSLKFINICKMFLNSLFVWKKENGSNKTMLNLHALEILIHQQTMDKMHKK